MAQSTEPAGAAEQIGPLLIALRTEKGYSQLRVAEKLCELSGISTVTRNEISRWERQERIPSLFSMRWLAAVFELPLERLEAAAAAARTATGAKPADGAPAEVGPRHAPSPDRSQPARAAHARGGADDPLSTVSIQFEHRRTRVKFSGTYADPRQAVSAISRFPSMVGSADAGRQADIAQPHTTSATALPSTLARPQMGIRRAGAPAEDRNGHA